MDDGGGEPCDFTVNENAGIYYGSDYWNDHAEVRAWLNRKVSGDPEVFWGDHAARTYGRTFRRALVLNCGNGHVERGLIENDLVTDVIGVDYSEELLDQARRAAESQGLPARYVQLDTNTGEFPDDEFDLVVNHAAAHHIAYIDRVFRELCRRLPEDGCFLSFDYVGPHRNQYGWAMWDAAQKLNRSLPSRFRQNMEYPHLPTMLNHDPTEAIHSELMLETMSRYFHLDEMVRLGGAIAYPLLTHNRNMFAVTADDPERTEVLDRILDADDEYTEAHPDETLFVYIAARPDKGCLAGSTQLSSWTASEDEREEAARNNGGQYYPLTTLQELTQRAERSRVDALHARERADDLATKLADLERAYAELQQRNTVLQAQCGSLQEHYDDLKSTHDRIMSLPPYRQLRWFARTGPGQRLRQRRRTN